MPDWTISLSDAYVFQSIRMLFEETESYFRNGDVRGSEYIRGGVQIMAFHRKSKNVKCVMLS